MFIAQTQWDIYKNGSSMYLSIKSFTGFEGPVNLNWKSLGLAFTIM